MSFKENSSVSAKSEAENTVLNMSDYIDIYHQSNGITRRDAVLCLQEYSPRFKWLKQKPKILDIGSGDGSVTEILSKFLPSDYEVLVGADINLNTIKFATNKYGNGRIKFIELNIERDLPANMRNSFDHIFSFYTFHWVDDHLGAFTNVYNILQKNGEFFAIFLLFSDVYFVFEILSKSKKWSPWMQNFLKFPSPYYDVEDPDVLVANMLRNIGFNVLDVRCKQRIYYHESLEAMKGIVTSINPFDIPKKMWPEFLDEFIDIQRNMHLIDENKRVKTHYNLMVIHCTK